MVRLLFLESSPCINNNNIRKKGLKARQKYVQPVGAWFSQLGELHVVHHVRLLLSLLFVLIFIAFSFSRSFIDVGLPVSI